MFFFSFSEEKKNQKEELFSNAWVFDVSGHRRGRCPSNPQTFEKV